MTGATFDKSRLLKLYARIGEDGVPKVLTFLDDAGAAYDISALDFELQVFRSAPNPYSVDPIFTLSIGGGMSVQGAGSNELLIQLDQTESEQKPDTYFWRLFSVGENHTWLNGPFFFHNGEFDGVDDEDTITVLEDGGTVEITVSGTSQGLTIGSYSTVLSFDQDKDIYHDATGLSPVFTFGTGNVNGMGIILRLNKPTAVTFPGNFEADANSATLDATKMNVYTLIYFANWNGSGTARVIYSNHLFTAV